MSCTSRGCWIRSVGDETYAAEVIHHQPSATARQDAVQRRGMDCDCSLPRGHPAWSLIKTETTKLTKNLHLNTKMRQNANEKYISMVWVGKDKDKLIILSAGNSNKISIFRTRELKLHPLGTVNLN